MRTMIDLDLFGDASMLGSAIADVTVVAHTKLQCWEIETEYLNTLLAVEPVLGFKFFASLAFETG